MISMNQEKQTTKNNSNYLSKTGVFDKYRGTYHDVSNTTVSPAKHPRDLNGSPLSLHMNQVAIKPRLLENGLANHPEFQTLSPAFKEILASEDGEMSMRLPICGYAGHRKGDKSENIFAKNYRQSTMIAARNLRRALQSPSHAK